jgi:hypothetical protein
MIKLHFFFYFRIKTKENESLDVWLEICKNYLSKIELVQMKHTDNESEQTSDEEQKEKVRRVVDFICATSKKIEKEPDMLINSAYNSQRFSSTVASGTQMFLDEKSPPHTSDSEVEEQFIINLMDIFTKACQMSNNSNNNAANNIDKSADRFKNK